MNNFNIVNADTDSISFSKPDGSAFSEQEQEELLKSLNSLYPEKIKWEHDGIYQVICVLKAKNYIKLHDGEIETKGSSIRNPNREEALKEFISKIIDCLVYDKQHEIINLYYNYVREVFNVKDITRWVVKKTVTASVLEPERANEQKVKDALGNRHVQMGDKYYFYFATGYEVVDEAGKKKMQYDLKIAEDWTGDHAPEKLLDKLYKTLNIFKNVYDMTQVPKLHLKSHQVKCQLADILGIPKPEKVKAPRKPRKKKVVDENNETMV